MFQYPEGQVDPRRQERAKDVEIGLMSFNTPKGKWIHEGDLTVPLARAMTQCFNTPKGKWIHEG